MLRDGTSDTQFDDLDRQIEDLQDRLETCRRAALSSRAALIAGTVVLGLVTTFAWAYRTPPIVFGSFTAILGGIVWLGANRTTRLELEDQLASLDSRKARLIDDVAARNGWRDMTPTLH